jgi:hypothetical protein
MNYNIITTVVMIVVVVVVVVVVAAAVTAMTTHNLNLTDFSVLGHVNCSLLGQRGANQGSAVREHSKLCFSYVSNPWCAQKDLPVTYVMQKCVFKQMVITLIICCNC